MIVTVTPNPSLDRTVLIGELRRGAVHRAEEVRLDPGGKGVNVARTLVAADRPTTCVLPTGGTEGTCLAELLAPEAVPVVEVPVGTATRSNVTLVESDGTTTKLNEPGNALSGAEIAALEERTAELATRADWVVACGSLPAGCPEDLYGRLVRAACAAGARVAVDTSGPPLREACRARADLVTPNLAELSELAERPLDRLGDVVDVAGSVQREGVSTVLVSLGADGALLVEGDSAWHATGATALVRSTVGAGDALLAGFLIAGARGPAALRHAVAYGSAAVQLPGSRMPTPDDLNFEPVRVVDVDESLTLNGTAA
ncbi:1-phosphofructokinase [Halopolyspora algeriensis]|uniref:1-phosphofructokinase n=1 Tax=Halopolyspora algeriensis TaxID=1500506 RepID=A0A368VJS7_9ACTN|nr:1-phosphofructokinase [Halopolyspora algeriensis]RCW40486.1 1-phosphofructokinase [Halopolyspora algeriensis]TQM53769.1 1-phosphofructokinase [Halopolyspora algeriensis]